MEVTVVDTEALAALPGEHRHLRSGVEQVRGTDGIHCTLYKDPNPPNINTARSKSMEK